LALTIIVVAWRPLKPFPAPFAVGRWHLVSSWVAFGLVAFCIHAWWHEGVYW
jgi:hypothetical protein